MTTTLSLTVEQAHGLMQVLAEKQVCSPEEWFNSVICTMDGERGYYTMPEAWATHHEKTQELTAAAVRFARTQSIARLGRDFTSALQPTDVAAVQEVYFNNPMPAAVKAYRNHVNSSYQTVMEAIASARSVSQVWTAYNDRSFPDYKGVS